MLKPKIVCYTQAQPPNRQVCTFILWNSSSQITLKSDKMYLKYCEIYLLQTVSCIEFLPEWQQSALHLCQSLSKNTHSSSNCKFPDPTSILPLTHHNLPHTPLSITPQALHSNLGSIDQWASIICGPCSLRNGQANHPPPIRDRLAATLQCMLAPIVTPHYQCNLVGHLWIRIHWMAKCAQVYC